MAQGWLPQVPRHKRSLCIIQLRPSLEVGLYKRLERLDVESLTAQCVANSRFILQTVASKIYPTREFRTVLRHLALSRLPAKAGIQYPAATSGDIAGNDIGV